MTVSRARVGLAVCVSGFEDLSRSAVGSTLSLSLARVGGPAGSLERRASGRRHKASRAAQLPALICDAPSRGWSRHSNRPRVARSCGRLHDDDVYPRAQSWRAWRSESVRPFVTAERRVSRYRPRPTAARSRTCFQLQPIHVTAVAASVRSAVVRRSLQAAAANPAACGQPRRSRRVRRHSKALILRPHRRELQQR